MKERTDLIFGKLRGVLKDTQVPAQNKYEQPYDKNGVIAPVAFLDFPDIGVRKVGVSALRSIPGLGVRVVAGHTSDRLYKLLIAGAKDVAQEVFKPRLTPQEERRRVRISFEDLTVALDGKTVLSRHGIDQLVWSEPQYEGAAFKRQLKFV